MKVFHYEVKNGDTLRQIAARFTGNPNRANEIFEFQGVRLNPKIPTTIREGQRTFATLRVGQVINLPFSWLEARGIGHIGGPSGQVGLVHDDNSSCSPGAKIAIKPYFLSADPSSEVWGLIETNFGLPGGKHIQELNRANVGRMSFAYWNDVCAAGKYEPGQLIAIPDSWPEPTDPAVIDRLRNSAGGKYVPGQAAPTCPDGSVWDVDQKKCVAAGGVVNVTPTCETGYHYDATLKTCVKDGGTGTQPPSCPAGTNYDPTTGTCVKGAGTGVGATEDTGKVSSWVWIGLAAAAGIGGALLLNNLIKAKRVHAVAMPSSSPPALPAHREEVVVRR